MTPAARVEALAARGQAYLRENGGVIGVLAGVVLAAYGFELFNLHLTIDEEFHADRDGPALEWIWQGRWGMYLLNALLLPSTVVPFVPLFVALASSLAAVLLMLDGWRIGGRLERGVAGAVALTFPGLAFGYSFAPLNFGLGIGWCCASASLLVWERARGWTRAGAIVPAALALAVHQAFLPVLVCLFLVSALAAAVRDGTGAGRRLLPLVAVIPPAIILYAAGQGLAMAVSGLTRLEYIGQFIDPGHLARHPLGVLRPIAATMGAVYLGADALYRTPLPLLPVLLAASLLGLAAGRPGSRRSRPPRLALGLAAAVLLGVPFAPGLLTRGYLAMRWMVAVPVVIAGVVALAMEGRPGAGRRLLAAVAGACVFQFTVATNHLFGAAHLALQADRLLASRVVERIDAAAPEAQAGTAPRYLVVVGYHRRPETRLIPKAETIGYSFFEWDQGSTERIVLFLRTIGFTGLQALPAGRHGAMVEAAEAMPAWPARGSVRAVGDTVILKFGPYSDGQRAVICAAGGAPRAFCP